MLIILLSTKNANRNQEKPAGDLIGCISNFPVDLQQNGDLCQKNIENSNEIVMTKKIPNCAVKNPKKGKTGVRV